MPTTETLDKVKKVIRDSLKLGPEATLGDDMPLMGGEYDLDSLDTLLLVTNIEKEFGIKFPDQAVGNKAFSNVTTLAEFVETLRR